MPRIAQRAHRRNPSSSTTTATTADIAAAQVARPLVTQMWSPYGHYPGKIIREPCDVDGVGLSEIVDYPKIAEWNWQQVTIRDPADFYALLRNAVAENSILIRGAPQPTTLNTTRRKKAAEDYPTGFIDTPAAWLALDIDNAPLSPGLNWQTDAEAAVRYVVDQLGPAFRGVTVVWQFTGTHGLKKQDTTGNDGEKINNWVFGELTSNTLRVRLFFLLDRAITCVQAINWIRLLKTAVPQLDEAVARQVQPIYILPPLFEGGVPDPIPDRVGLIRGRSELVHVPDNLDKEIAWARAEGSGQADEVVHPSLEAALGAIGRPLKGQKRGTIFPHLKSAARHLLEQNPRDPSVSVERYIVEMTATLERLVRSERRMAMIAANLLRFNRSKSELLDCFNPNAKDNRFIGRFVDWIANKKISLRLRKAIRRSNSRQQRHNEQTAQAIFAQELVRGVDRRPTGAGKSTKLRLAAVQAAEQLTSKETVVVAVPRHKLGQEQIEALRREYPGSRLEFAIWRGWEADDPAQPGKKMCWRHDEAKTLRKLKVDVGKTLCQQGDLRCPLFEQCGMQRQKQQRADIWFVAHESLMHDKPAALGKIKVLLIDEDATDAYLPEPEEISFEEFARPSTISERKVAAELNAARRGLIAALDQLDDGAVPKYVLHHFAAAPGRDPEKQVKREWREKITPQISPTMSKEEVERAAAAAASNALLDKRVKLWRLVSEALRLDAPRKCGRLSVKTYDDGSRSIVIRRISAINKKFGTPTTFADAGADAELLRYVLDALSEEGEEDGDANADRADSVSGATARDLPPTGGSVLW